MKLARIALDGRAHWAIVAGTEFHVLEGPPYGSIPARTGQVVGAEEATLLAPATPTKIFGVGRNYESHRIAMGLAASDVPATLMKPPTTVIGHGAAVALPPRAVSSEVAYEAELAIVIGVTARNVAPTEAHQVILGYTCADDVSARDLQRRDPQPTRAKGFDTFCPLGPWVETDLDPTGGTRIRSWVNGELRQDASTADMTFGVATIVSFLSSFATLLPGDVILTGSPPGAGTIAPGDRIDIDIDGIGVLTHLVV